MDLTSSEESSALAETVRMVLEGMVTPDLIRSVGRGPDNSEVRLCWEAISETGVLGALVPEVSGGLDLSMTDVIETFEAFGYFGTPLPYIESICLTAPAMAAADSTLLDGVLKGNVVVTATTSAADPAGYAGMSDFVLVGSEEQAEPSAYMCECSSSVLLAGSASIDESRAFRYVDVPDEARLMMVDAKSWERATIASASALVGLSRRILDMTVEYVAQRQQFGRPIGSFQAIKHQLADVEAKLVRVVPLIKAGACEVDRTEAGGFRYVSAAKIMAGRVAAETAKVGLQCHGAMAYTTEYDLQLFAKQIWALSVQWGSVTQHRRRLAQQLDTELVA